MKRLGPVAVGLTLLAGACGIPQDSEPRVISQDAPTAIPAPATPQPAVTQLFPIYLVDADNRMQQAIRELPDPLTISALVTELIEEPTAEESEARLVSIVPPEITLMADPFQEGGRAQLDFVSGTGFDTLLGEDLTLALSQLVWTLTESPSINSVLIRIDGQDQAWPTDEEDISAGAPLRRSDYNEFGSDFAEPTPTPVAEPPSEDIDPPSEGADPTPEPIGNGG